MNSFHNSDILFCQARKARRPGRLLKSVALVPPNISPSGCFNHLLREIVLGDTCQNATRKIASTVVVGQTSSGLIGAVSPSLIPASLPEPLALQPSFQLPSFS